MKQDDYGDIIDLPHHVSETRAHMSMIGRGAQFSPFAALTGYEDAIRETERRTDTCPELGEDEKTELNRRLQLLAEHEGEHPALTVTLFEPDPWKDGGSFVRVTGALRRVEPAFGRLQLTDGTEIALETVLDVETDLPEA